MSLIFLSHSLSFIFLSTIVYDSESHPQPKFLPSLSCCSVVPLNVSFAYHPHMPHISVYRNFFSVGFGTRLYDARENERHSKPNTPKQV